MGFEQSVGATAIPPPPTSVPSATTPSQITKMTSISRLELLSLSLLHSASTSRRHHQMPCRFICRPGPKLSPLSNLPSASNQIPGPATPVSVAASSTLLANAVPVIRPYPLDFVSFNPNLELFRMFVCPLLSNFMVCWAAKKWSLYSG
ncbi:UNVERIFIED_CONTAM: hypothetical protein Sradi_4219400 [Sesamum radiatum]|uniref:Uncharacterized protein n=1 Tax=Sesamum radiatum TaxID=300843 RepID=A0AAW2P3J5_SESRA